MGTSKPQAFVYMEIGDPFPRYIFIAQWYIWKILIPELETSIQNVLKPETDFRNEIHLFYNIGIIYLNIKSLIVICNLELKS